MCTQIKNGGVDVVGGAVGGDTHSAPFHVKERKEQLSKQAKRRRADRMSE